MEFIFVCPVFQKVFESEAFSLTHNNGIKTDENGDKFLDAKATLTHPCPYCGEKHSFAVKDLACPFNKNTK